MEISKLAQSLGQSATLKLNEVANSLRAEGKPVIHLGGGEPVEAIPLGAAEGARKMIAGGFVRYTPSSGTVALKDEIIKYTDKYYGIKPERSNIVVSSGAKQAIYNFLVSVLDEDDEVIIPVPYWVSYPEMVSLAHGEPVMVRPSQGLLVSIADISSAITNKTRAIMLNSPCNPSGQVFPAETIAGLVELCERNDIYLVMDDIYNRLVFDGLKAISAYSYSKRPLNESVIVSINGVSKTFSMTGFRIGWSIANAELTKAMIKVQAQISSCPSALSQAAAVGALSEQGDFVEKLRKGLEEKRNILLGELSKFKKVKIDMPHGTFYSFPDFSAYEPDSRKLSALLLEKALVAAVPGIEFGMEGHLRISYCASAENIVEGLSRIRKVLDEHKKLVF